MPEATDPKNDAGNTSNASQTPDRQASQDTTKVASSTAITGGVVSTAGSRDGSTVPHTALQGGSLVVWATSSSQLPNGHIQTCYSNGTSKITETIKGIECEFGEKDIL